MRYCLQITPKRAKIKTNIKIHEVFIALSQNSIKHANIKKILDPWESDRPITKKTIEAITEIELKILEML